jgi:molybdenum cofactor cytidylyltransferase
LGAASTEEDESARSMTDRPAVVVLAAGKGSRFAGARHKLLQPLGTSTVLGATLANVIATGLPIVVVTTEALLAEAASLVARRDIVVLSDGEAARGMGSSIAAGVSARGDAQGWLVLPADMPLVRPATILAVAAAVADHAVAYAQHQGRRGHPVGFSPELYSELVVLQGDEGARRLLARYPALPVEVDDPGVLVDIDTSADLAAARGSAAPVTASPGR